MGVASNSTSPRFCCAFKCRHISPETILRMLFPMITLSQGQVRTKHTGKKTPSSDSASICAKRTNLHFNVGSDRALFWYTSLVMQQCRCHGGNADRSSVLPMLGCWLSFGLFLRAFFTSSSFLSTNEISDLMVVSLAGRFTIWGSGN